MSLRDLAVFMAADTLELVTDCVLEAEERGWRAPTANERHRRRIEALRLLAQGTRAQRKARQGDARAMKDEE